MPVRVFVVAVYFAYAYMCHIESACNQEIYDSPWATGIPLSKVALLQTPWSLLNAA